MHSEVLSSFVKHALSMNTLRSYLGARAAQGVGGASALGKSLAGSGAQTSRQAVQGMTGLQKHRLGGVMQGGKDVRQMQRLPSQVGLGQTAKNTRARVEGAVRQEAANPGSSRTGGVQLSRAYEGYMDTSGKSYNPAHMEQVMGLAPGSVKLKGGPTALMKPRPKPTKPQGGTFTGMDEVTMPEATVPSRPAAAAPPSSSGMRPSVRPTARPPARPPVRAQSAGGVNPYAPTMPPPPMVDPFGKTMIAS